MTDEQWRALGSTFRRDSSRGTLGREFRGEQPTPESDDLQDWTAVPNRAVLRAYAQLTHKVHGSKGDARDTFRAMRNRLEAELLRRMTPDPTVVQPESSEPSHGPGR